MMKCNGYDKVLDISDGDLVELRDARGSTLRVTRGTLWITQERDHRDIVLRAGDVWTVERQGLTIAQAQGAATICVVGEAAERAKLRGRRVRVPERIEALFRSLGAARFGRRWVPYL